MSARSRPRAVLVDLDGTLLDTAPDLAVAVNAMLAELALAPLATDAVRDFVGRGIDHLVLRSLQASAGHAPQERLCAAARESFARHYERANGKAARVYPGVREGLAAVREQGLPLACVTNKLARFTLPLLAATGLAEGLDAVVTSDMVGRRKPDPAILLHACRALEVEPAQAVVIGDSENDRQAARAAGCGFLLVPYGYREGRDVQDIECDGIVATLMDAARAFSHARAGAASTART
jgi:phosphoglycolate phosphatase